MPVLLLIFILPFLILSWMVRYLIHLRARETEEQMRMEIAKAERDARIARPLRDYVAGLKPQQASRIPFRTAFLGNSPPTLENIGRFAALSIRGHTEEYFVRDDQDAVYGPADETTILQWIRERRITADTLTSSHAEGPWLPARKIRALEAAFENVVQSSVSAGRFDNIQIK